jgi:uncharacterized protein YjdB
MIDVILESPRNNADVYEANQWDIGQKISLTGTDVTDCAVYWAYATLPTGQTTDKREFTLLDGETDYTGGGVVGIPDKALEQSGDITGYIYKGTGTEKETIGYIVIHPVEQDMPEDYVSDDNVVTLQDIVETAVDAAMPTFEIGTVEAGEAPAAALTETETGYALDLTLQTGPTGTQGPTGPTGPQGPTGPTGPAGADGESIEVLEISEAEYLAIETPDIRTLYLVDCTIHVVSVSLDYSSGQIGAGNTFQLTETILPINAADKTVSWSSSDTDVATVDSNGLVTGVADGTAIITCTTTDGTKTATFVATVISNPQLWSGTKGPYNGLTMLIEIDENNDTYLTITGTVTTNAAGYYTDNVPLVFDITGIDKWCTMASGDELSLTTEKISGTNPTGANSIFGIIDMSNNIILAGPTHSTPTGTYTATLSGNKDIRGFRGYFTANQTYNAFKLKATFSVNGQKWF